MVSTNEKSDSPKIAVVLLDVKTNEVEYNRSI